MPGDERGLGSAGAGEGASRALTRDGHSWPRTSSAGYQDEPWATGVARVGFTDNDAEVGLTRTNSFGDRLQATVTDADGGTWRDTSIARFQIDRDDEFHVRTLTFNLRRVGR